MTTAISSLTARPAWEIISAGLSGVAIAERDALGTTARVAVWPAKQIAWAIAAVDRELRQLDLVASRFRADSELSRVHAANGASCEISAALTKAVGVALAAAQWTGGMVDPTVGSALIALGYDRDFVEIAGSDVPAAASGSAVVPGWQHVRLERRMLQLPPGVRLDLGATAKGLGADRAAKAASAAARGGGALVSLGGDVAAAGVPTWDGWPVLIADDADAATNHADPGPAQVVRISAGGLATSSIACRQWRRAGETVHHIIDPRTGLPAVGSWRTVTAFAATCAEANAASTAAIVMGADAASWLTSVGVPARLIGHDGTVLHVCGWPACDNEKLAAVRERMGRSAPRIGVPQ